MDHEALMSIIIGVIVGIALFFFAAIYDHQTKKRK